MWDLGQIKVVSRGVVNSGVLIEVRPLYKVACMVHGPLYILLC